MLEHVALSRDFSEIEQFQLFLYYDGIMPNFSIPEAWRGKNWRYKLEPNNEIHRQRLQDQINAQAIEREKEEQAAELFWTYLSHYLMFFYFS